MAGNLLLLAIVAYLVIGKPYQSSASVPQAPQLSSQASDVATSALDQLASATIAETAAKMTGAPEIIPITNQADSEIALLNEASTTDDTLSSKPQVVATAFKSNKDIRIYVVQPGDSVSSIASKFGVTSDSIRWSNGLSGDAVNAGTKLKVLPGINGIIYTVKAGDTPQSLATKYGTSADKIIMYNDAEKGLPVGEVIIIPDGSIVRQVVHSSSSYRGSAAYGYNGYDYGYCTWWVAYLRQKAGNPLPSNLGNASTWAIRAAAFGLPTGKTPRVGAAAVTSTRGAGHVVYVTAVNPDGSIVVSEMNHLGWNKTDTRTISGDFTYIY